jgi:uncharacterized protein YkwD
MTSFIKHWIFPHESNNQRSKLLHIESFLVVTLFLFAIGIVITPFKSSYPGVLGIQTNISIDRLVADTNTERVKQGLSPLTLDSELSEAAKNKASDMFSKDYWAHFAPDGGTPWGFIKASGYEYIYAGENLARGFTTPESVVAAWMASPSHRENMLSRNYTDVGFAVASGKLTGEDTILVVEMFGSRQIAQVPQLTPVNSHTETTNMAPINIPETRKVAAVVAKPLVNTQSVGKQIALTVVILFLLLFLFDILIIERKQIVRIISHNINQIFYLLFILGMILIISKGNIL